MPTIELTDEQAEELKSVLADHLSEAEDYLSGYDDGDGDHIQYRHQLSVLSDILHLLEIA
jgi:hypothetical protein